jgi:hypothetical protein
VKSNLLPFEAGCKPARGNEMTRVNSVETESFVANAQKTCMLERCSCPISSGAAGRAVVSVVWQRLLRAILQVDVAAQADRKRETIDEQTVLL